MICPGFSEPLYFFYAPDLPGLLYYAYVPAIIAAFLVGMLMILHDRKSLLNRLLFGISMSFLVWTFATLILWTNIHSDFMLFVWSLLGPAAGFISILSVYFTYVFLDKKDINPWIKCIFTALLLPLIVLVPSSYALRGFNLVRCDAFGLEGLTNTVYFPALGVLAMVWIFTLLVRRYRTANSDLKKQIALMGAGMELFLFSFFVTEFLGQYLTSIGFLPDSQLETYGYFGMIVFVVYIAILIVRFKVFRVQLIAAQALFAALFVLIVSQFAYVRNATNIILTGITLVLTLVVGYLLVRSIKKEIEQREKIEQLAKELAATNERQETLIHFIGHEMKGFLTKSAGTFASLSEGDFGALPEAMKPLVDQALVESRQGVDAVGNILKAANLKKGTVTYTKEPFDLKELVAEAVEKAKSVAEEKDLKISFTSDDASYKMTGDKTQISDHVLRNLIDNAINYTPSGSIEVSLKRQGTRIIFAVKDSGVGITDEDKKRLFTEGGHGADSQRINVHSTGYGLYIAKQITEAHGGTIRAESEGQGKGSTFIAEFPV